MKARYDLELKWSNKIKVGDSPEERDGPTGTSTRTEVAGGSFTIWQRRRSR